MQVQFAYLKEAPSGVWQEVDKIVPATKAFPYWTFYYTREGEDRCAFHHIDQVGLLIIRGGKEVNGTISQSEVPNVRREHRSDDSSGDS